MGFFSFFSTTGVLLQPRKGDLRNGTLPQDIKKRTTSLKIRFFKSKKTHTYCKFAPKAPFRANLRTCGAFFEPPQKSNLKKRINGV